MPIKVTCSKILIVSLSLIISHFSHAKDYKSEDIIERLRTGGYILYLRHGATDHSQKDQNLNDFRQCHHQRNLSNKGREESIALGKAIEKFNIPVGEVLSSPFCRCVDTALYAFNKVEIEEGLTAMFFEKLDGMKTLTHKLNTLLSTPPKNNSNTVLVGHTANLREATNIWPKPEGVVHVFKPLESQDFEHVGKIPPDEWNRLLQKDPTITE